MLQHKLAYAYMHGSTVRRTNRSGFALITTRAFDSHGIASGILLSSIVASYYEIVRGVDYREPDRGKQRHQNDSFKKN